MRLSSACFGKQVHPQMDQTSCNAEQIGIVEDLSQMLKIIFYPLPLYYHLFKQKTSFEILVEKRAECMLFVPSCCGSLIFLSCALFQPWNNLKDSWLMCCTQLLSLFPPKVCKNYFKLSRVQSSSNF